MKEKVTQEPRTQNREPRTENREPRTENRTFRDFADLKALTKNTARVVRDNEATDRHFRPMVSTAVVNEVRRKKLNFQRELDIRGLRADEATEQLTDYMDDAVMVAAGTVTILHGTGTGALKQITRDYLQVLQRAGRIRSYHDGDPDRGGAGLTIVEI
jgi:DNA mismatch repair protein MutS2